jgi:hypothetical protein
MSRKAASKTKLTDAERHKRFVEMAKQVGASDDAKDFDRAFEKIAKPPSRPSPAPKASRGSRS